MTIMVDRWSLHGSRDGLEAAGDRATSSDGRDDITATASGSMLQVSEDGTLEERVL